MGKLDGKIALVTGGTTGIGLAAARLFQQEGAQVYVTGRSESKLAEVKRQLPGVVALRSDAAELGDIDRLAAEIERRSGRLERPVHQRRYRQIPAYPAGHARAAR